MVAARSVKAGWPTSAAQPSAQRCVPLQRKHQAVAGAGQPALRSFCPMVRPYLPEACLVMRRSFGREVVWCHAQEGASRPMVRRIALGVMAASRQNERDVGCRK